MRYREYNLQDDVLKSYMLLLTIRKKRLENNLAFADTFRYISCASCKPVILITGFVVLNKHQDLQMHFY